MGSAWKFNLTESQDNLSVMLLPRWCGAEGGVRQVDDLGWERAPK